MTLYLGIDPGKTGAMAVVSPEGHYVHHREFTTWVDVFEFIKDMQYKSQLELIAGLEKVHAVPGAGSVSSWSFAANCGGYIALLEALQIPYHLIPPMSWMPKILGAFPKGESKKAALAHVGRVYPQLQLKKSQHGIADALCIANYVRQFK